MASIPPLSLQERIISSLPARHLPEKVRRRLSPYRQAPEISIFSERSSARMKNLVFVSILGLFCILLAGCGGGSSSATSGGQPGSGTGRAIFTVIWPQTTRLVPEASHSVRVDISNGTNLVVSKLLVR